MLKIDSVVKFYGEFAAIKNISLELEKGKIYGFVGPNGAGKTTLFKMIATLLRPSHGKIYLDGKNIVKEYKYARSKIGYMPDFFGVYNEMKTYEYMDFYADINLVPQNLKKERIDKLLKLVNLDHKRNSYVDSLSRGMKQRLCLARCLIHDPSIIILDEPASGMDPRARIEMKNILKSLQHENKIIIVSSHILHELSQMCDEIIVLNSGEIEFTGKIDDILKEVDDSNTIEIKTVSNHKKCLEVLKSYKGVTEVSDLVDKICLEFNGTDEKLADLLMFLVNQSIQVVSFCKIKHDIEDVFMRITGGDSDD